MSYRVGVQVRMCRCCNKQVISSDWYQIHTRCIPKHWGKHVRGVNHSRCKEFKKK